MPHWKVETFISMMNLLLMYSIRQPPSVLNSSGFGVLGFDAY